MLELNTDFKWGDIVKDRVTGMQGRIVCIGQWEHGCVRITIQPPGSKDGKAYAAHSFDEPDAEYVQKARPKKAAAPRHGPYPAPSRR